MSQAKFARLARSLTIDGMVVSASGLTGPSLLYQSYPDRHVANVRSTSGLALEDFGTNGKEKNGLINAAASSTILLLFLQATTSRRYSMPNMKVLLSGICDNAVSALVKEGGR